MCGYEAGRIRSNLAYLLGGGRSYFLLKYSLIMRFGEIDSRDSVSPRWNVASACGMAVASIAFCRKEVRKTVGALLKTAWNGDDALMRERRSWGESRD
jgi:hypothetical protein